MKRILGYLTFLASAAVAMPAGAITWSTNSDTVGTCNGSTSSCTLTDTANGNTAVKFRAYSVNAWQGSNANGPVSGNWITANMEFFSGNGYGVANTIQQAATEEQTEPQHGTDNRETVDIMVIELPTLPPGQAWDPTSLELGYARQINSTGGVVSGSTTAGLSMFIGNLASNYDFAANNVCFDTAGGTCLAGQKGLLSTLGFQDITSAIAGGGGAVAQNSSTGITTSAAGNYLVVTGRLGEGDDAFKFKSISATGTTTQTPLPGTLALLGFGLVGLIAHRRRVAARA